MIEYYKNVLKNNYSNFDGRARRSEFWYYNLMNMIIVITLVILVVALVAVTQSAIIGGIIGILILLYVLGTFIPSIAVLVRRLHDVGKSGWWYFIALVPIVGTIWLLVLLFTDSQEGSNEYGANPKTNEVDLINTIK